LLELSVHEDVAEAQALGDDPGLAQGASELRSGERRAHLERSSEHVVAAPERARVQLELAIHGPVRGVHARRGQPQHPADVGRGDEVPRRAQDMGAEDLAARERLLDPCVGAAFHALADRPLRLGELLSLHRSEPTDRLGGLGEAGGRQALGVAGARSRAGP